MNRLIFGLILFLISCVSPTPQSNLFYVNKDHIASDSENRKVLFSPLSEASCKINNSSTVLKEENKKLKFECSDLLRVFNDLVKQYFRNKPFLTQLHDSDSALAEFTLSIEASDTVAVTQPLGRHPAEHEFHYPKKGFLTERSVDADIVIYVSEMEIVIEDLEIPQPMAKRTYKVVSRRQDPTGAQAVVETVPNMKVRHSVEVVKAPAISTKVKYIIWDYEHDTALGYGQFVVEGGPYRLYSQDIDRTWTYFSASALSTISSKTPFIEESADAGGDCTSRSEAVSYMNQVGSRVYEHWYPEAESTTTEVKLSFKIDVAGSASDVEFAGGNSALGAGAVDAMREASPFPPLLDSARCLADRELFLTFTINPDGG
jgi:hypothetical protein